MDVLTLVVLALFAVMIVAWVLVPAEKQSHAPVQNDLTGATAPSTSAQ